MFNLQVNSKIWSITSIIQKIISPKVFRNKDDSHTLTKERDKNHRSS